MWMLSRIWARVWLWLTGMPVRLNGKIPDDDELESTAGEIFLFAYLESKAFRTQKDRRVFRI